jgi:hypothetical protein
MPTKKKPTPRATKAAPPAPAAPAEAQPASAPLNREQRRAQKFGKAGKVHQHDPVTPWPENAANPALLAVTDGTEDEGSDAKKAPKS